MKRTLFSLLAAGGLGLAMTPGLGPQAQPPSPPPVRLDVGKEAIEAPARRVVAHAVPAPAGADAPFINPKVEPGKAHWHADFAEACRAAARSGKPVLLFQMMGRLDDKFC